GLGNRLGRVSFVGSAIDADSRTFPIEIALDNAGRDLKPEMVAQVMVTRENLTGATVVPRDAVLRDELGTAVFVVKREGGAKATAERRSVTTGAAYGNRVVITSGIEPGDEIVTAGQTTLTDGDLVLVVARNEQPVASLGSGETE
ncbi:MAG TPA: efflux RND transporter periplasmic adaptor subunit, partial [Rhodothermales bacterium]